MRVLPRGLFLFGKVLVGRRRRAAALRGARRPRLGVDGAGVLGRGEFSSLQPVRRRLGVGD